MNEIVVELLRGNGAHADAFHDRFDDVQDAQHPAAVTVSCADSRVLQDHLWGNDEPGRLFTCSNIGNRVSQRTESGTVVSGDVLFPLVHTGTETVVVVGHTGCGAVTAAFEDLTRGIEEPAGIDHCLGLLKSRLADGVDSLPDDIDRMTAIDRLVEYNVDRQVESLLRSDDVPEAVESVGVVYDFQDAYGGRRGDVHVVNIGGERDPEVLRAAYPEIEDRIERLWVY